jgi:Leucine Rich repeat
LISLSKSLVSGNKTLISLNISSNSLTPVGASCLFQALEQNEALVHLDLSSHPEARYPNKLGPYGADLLASLLTRNLYLQFVNIRCTLIGNEGFKSLCHVLPLNRSLLSLNLENN